MIRRMFQLVRALERAAVGTALVLPLVVLSASAQTSPDPGPEEERAAMTGMMREMQDLRAEMDHMHDEMVKQGMGPMRERMRDMRQRMGRMTEMMERYHHEYRAGCPGMKPLPKSGG